MSDDFQIVAVPAEKLSGRLEVVLKSKRADAIYEQLRLLDAGQVQRPGTRYR
jgi:hypothetical protein